MSMPENALMGVDVGTTLIKVVAYSETLSILGEARVRTPWITSGVGVEADPEVLAQTAIRCIEQALSAIARPVRVRALGITGMGETGVLADARGRPMAPAIAWHDERGGAEAGALAAELPGFAGRSGRRADERPSVVKWRWLRANGYELEGARRWYAVAEWVAVRLGARPGSELSLASRTGCLDVRAGELFTEALAWSGADPGWLGQLVPAGVAAGRAEVGPAEIRGAVVSVAGLDCYASSHALDADVPETAFLSCGTSGATVRILEKWPDRAAAAAAGFTVDRYLDGRRAAVLGATPCGLVLQPLRDRLGPPGAAPGPEWNRAYDAVAEAESHLIGSMERFCDPTRRVVTAGGWIEHAGLEEALRRRLGPSLDSRDDQNSAARGAAMLARDAAGF